MGSGFPGRILIIDDDPDTRDVYREVLTEAGLTVEFAANGEEGLAKILQGGYDLILLDIMMPKIDGLAILKKLQGQEQTVYNGPIIVLSQLDQPQIIETAKSLGAKGYLVKSGMTPGQILEKVSALLQTHQ